MTRWRTVAGAGAHAAGRTELRVGAKEDVAVARQRDGDRAGGGEGLDCRRRVRLDAAIVCPAGSERGGGDIDGGGGGGGVSTVQHRKWSHEMVSLPIELFDQILAGQSLSMQRDLKAQD